MMKFLCLILGVNICPTREVTVGSAELTVTSPDWPDEYPSNQNCTLTINTSERKVIYVEFEEFAMEEDGDGALCSSQGFHFN